MTRTDLTTRAWRVRFVVLALLAGLVGMHHLAGGGHGAHAAAAAPVASAATLATAASGDDHQPAPAHPAAARAEVPAPVGSTTSAHGAGDGFAGALDASVPLVVGLSSGEPSLLAACAVALLSALVVVAAVGAVHRVVPRGRGGSGGVATRSRRPRARAPGSLLTQLCVLRT